MSTKLNDKSQTTSKWYSGAKRWTGFQKTSNFTFFVLTAVIFAVFAARQSVTTLPEGHRLKPSPPGPRFWAEKNWLTKFGMQTHLATVIPASVYLPLQFLPAMRQKYMLLHKLSGRLLLVLLLLGNITAVVLARHAFGGTVTTQGGTYFQAALISFTIYKAWTSARNLHIDQHRSWTLRTWAYAGAILTLRINMGVFVYFIVKFAPHSFKAAMNCEEILFMYQSVANVTSVASMPSRYPACATYTATGPPVYVVVNAFPSRAYPEERAAILNMVFGVSGWLALMLHVLIIEIYLNATKDEDERLKKNSAVRRKAAGME